MKKKLFQHYCYLEFDNFLYVIRINFVVIVAVCLLLIFFQWLPCCLLYKKSYVAYGFSSYYTTSYSVENFSRALKLCVIVWWCCRWLPACFLVCFYGGCTVARKYQYTRCHFLFKIKIYEMGLNFSTELINFLVCYVHF